MSNLDTAQEETVFYFFTVKVVVTRWHDLTVSSPKLEAYSEDSKISLHLILKVFYYVYVYAKRDISVILFLVHWPVQGMIYNLLNLADHTWDKLRGTQISEIFSIREMKRLSYYLWFVLITGTVIFLISLLVIIKERVLFLWIGFNARNRIY